MEPLRDLQLCQDRENSEVSCGISGFVQPAEEVRKGEGEFFFDVE